MLCHLRRIISFSGPWFFHLWATVLYLISISQILLYFCKDFIWERERESMHTSKGSGRQRQREKQVPWGAGSLMWGFHPRALDHDHDWSWRQTLNQLSHPGAPELPVLKWFLHPTYSVSHYPALLGLPNTYYYLKQSSVFLCLLTYYLFQKTCMQFP